MLYFDEDPKQWIFLEKTHSTNIYFLEKEVASGTICIAKEQTSGRGQQNRTWLSWPNESFIFSGCLKTNKDIHFLSILSLSSALACVEALESFVQDHKDLFSTLPKFSIKWPNDILLLDSEKLEDGKLGGILIESKKLKNNQLKIVIGIGINWNASLKNIKKDFQNLPSTEKEKNQLRPRTLFLSQRKQDPKLFLPYLIKKMNTSFSLLQEDPKKIIEKSKAYFYLKDKFISYASKVYLVKEISDQGGLLLEDSETTFTREINSTQEKISIINLKNTCNKNRALDS